MQGSYIKCKKGEERQKKLEEKQKNNEVTFPVIGKSEVFSDPESGNKLSRNGTVSFKGTQQTILSKYGQLFRIEEINDGMFKMIAITEADLAKLAE